MDWWIILLIIISSFIIFFLGILFFIYFMVFYNNLKKQRLYESPEHAFDKDIAYASYKDILSKNYLEASKLTYEDVYINSFDHKRLHGKLYIKDINNAFIIMFHGYKGGGIRDFHSILLSALNKGFNCLVIDERSHGLSEGRTITFGIKERYDVLNWANYIYSTYPDNNIFLYGISMGGGSVLMASDLFLPTKVKGIIADCPVSSPKKIVESMCKAYRLPLFIFKPLVFLSCYLIGRFNIFSSSGLKSVPNSNVPLILFHGTNDNLVPFSMSEDLLKASEGNVKELVSIGGAPHAISFTVNQEKYEEALYSFIDKYNINK